MGRGRARAARIVAALFTAALLSGCLAGVSGAADAPHLAWVLEDGSVTITGAEGALPAALVIPEEIAGLPVHRIGRRAFCGDASITRVTLPDSLEEIGDEAFRGCVSLEEVQVGNTLESIGEEAFAFCENLCSIEFPADFSTIGAYAFWHCSALAAADVPDSVKSLPDGVFGYCRALSRLSLPDSLSRIGALALAGTALEALEIPAAVLEIGDSAFSGCTQLQILILPARLRTIPPYMASDCSALETVVIPESVQTVCRSAFAHCGSLGRVSIPGGCETIGELAFWGCAELSFVAVPDGVSEIEYGTFWNCRELTEVALPAGIATIDAMAFYGTKLRDVWYAGTEEQWSSVTVKQTGYTQTGAEVPSSNAALLDAQMHFGQHGTKLPEGVKIREYSSLWIEEKSSEGALLCGLEAGRPVSGVTAANVLGQFIIPPTVAAQMLSARGDAMAGEDIVGTGCVLEMMPLQDEALFEACVVMEGDVLGTGRMSLSQLVRVAEAFRGVCPLGGVYLIAADNDENGRIDLADVVREAQLYTAVRGRPAV